MVITPLKTARSRRSASLDPETVAALRDHRRRQNEDRLRAGELWSGEGDYVFTDELGQLVHPSTLSRLFDRSEAEDRSGDRSAIGGRRVSRYDMDPVEIYASARKHGIVEDDIVHAVEHALAIGEQDNAKVLSWVQTAPGTSSKSSRWPVRMGQRS